MAHLAYSSDNGITLKVLCDITPVRKKRLHLKWMLTIPYIDALEISEGKKEISLFDSSQVTALEIGKNTDWDCLLIKKM